MQGHLHIEQVPAPGCRVIDLEICPSPSAVTLRRIELIIVLILGGIIAVAVIAGTLIGSSGIPGTERGKGRAACLDNFKTILRWDGECLDAINWVIGGIFTFIIIKRFLTFSIFNRLISTNAHSEDWDNPGKDHGKD